MISILSYISGFLLSDFCLTIHNTFITINQRYRQAQYSKIAIVQAIKLIEWLKWFGF